MKTRSSHAPILCTIGAAACAVLASACAQGEAPAPEAAPTSARIILLHHSTGECVWNGGVPAWFEAHNAAHKTDYRIAEQAFPKESPYGWENYPYDYWNIWVKNAGPKPFKEEPTLEILTARYDVIVFKHCFPVSGIQADTGQADVASSEKRAENYKLQYAALKKKMREFPKVRFILWTGAALVKNETDEVSARRARAFFDWVRREWDEKGDNIYLWDFHHLETEGDLYMKDGYAAGDSHPNETFSRKVAPLLAQRIVDVIQGRGDTASITGQAAADVPPAAPPTPPQRQEPPGKVPEPARAPPEPAPAVTAPAAGPGIWVFDDAENEALRPGRWTKGAAYAKDGTDNVIRIDFAQGEEEDWGEYGKQRLVWTAAPVRNYDLRPFHYVALRLKADREMEVVLTLFTLPEPRGPRHQPHFGFTAYLRTAVGAWKWVALDLGKLELSVEGEGAYEKAGKPTRPNDLTALRFGTSKKNENAALLIDDVTFLRDLPDSLKGSLQAP